MEEIQNKIDGSTSHWSFLEILSRHAFSFIGLSYIFGFIIVNSYLASFGLVSIGIIKAKYIAAGVVFLLFVSLCGLILYPTISHFLRVKEKGEFKPGEILWSIGSLMIIEVLLIYVAPDSLTLSDKPSWISLKGLLAVIGIISLLLIIPFRFVKKLSKLMDPLYFVGMGIFAYLLFRPSIFIVLSSTVGLVLLGAVVTSNVREVLSKKKSFTGYIAINIIYLVSITLGVCETYTRYLYPKIENKYGGGKPVDVTLFLEKDLEPSFKLIFEDSQKSSETIENVSLIDEDGDYFFIQKKTPQQNRTIRIKKSLVNAVVHEKKQ